MKPGVAVIVASNQYPKASSASVFYSYYKRSADNQIPYGTIFSMIVFLYSSDQYQCAVLQFQICIVLRPVAKYKYIRTRIGKATFIRTIPTYCRIIAFKYPFTPAIVNFKIV